MGMRPVKPGDIVRFKATANQAESINAYNSVYVWNCDIVGIERDGEIIPAKGSPLPKVKADRKPVKRKPKE